MMLSLSDRAKQEIRSLLSGKRGRLRCMRLVYQDSPYIEMVPIAPEVCHPDSPRVLISKKSIIGLRPDFTVILDPAQTELLAGSHVHYLENSRGPGAFEIFLASERAPQPKAEPKKSSAAESPEEIKIQEFLDKEINPAIASHGGFAEIMKLRDNVAYLKLGGGCQGCAASSLTLRQGIESKLKEVFPEIHEVVDSTDHAAGTAPYLRSLP